MDMRTDNFILMKYIVFFCRLTKAVNGLNFPHMSNLCLHWSESKDVQVSRCYVIYLAYHKVLGAVCS
jgi:hypothetical protein